MEHCYDPAVFAAADGLAPEELRSEIRAVYEEGERANIPFAVTRARMLECFLQHVRIAVNDFDPFASLVERQTLSPSPRSEILTIQNERKAIYAKAALGDEIRNAEAVRKGVYRCRLDLSHTSPDWDNVLKLGVPGLLERAERCCREKPSPFAESVRIAYAAFRDFLLRYASIAEKAGRTDLAQMLAFLSDHAPETLHQALELGLLYRELQEIEGEWVRSMGIFDRMYRPFYEADLTAGRLTEAEAEDLLAAYFSRFLVQSQGRDNGTPFCFGGLLPESEEDGCNGLTRLAWKVFRDLGRIDPKFSLRINSKTPDDVLYFAAECIKEGKTSMVLANESVARKMFLRHGKDPADLANFIPVGCYEPTIMGKELSCTMTVLFNFAGLFRELFADSVFSPAAFDDVLGKYLELQKNELAHCMELTNRLEKDWNRVQPSPLLSGTMDDCMARGLDVSQYGTKYASSGIMCAGIGTAADSLAAIRRLVFEEKRVSFSALGVILRSGWKDHEELRLLAAKRMPKWGNGEEMVDSLAETIVHAAGEQILHTPNAKGGSYQMGLWSIDWCYIFGRETEATPDGRHCGDPLSRNTGSTTACDNEGVAGLIDSVSKLDHTYFADGGVLDVMLSPHSVSGEAGSELIVRLIRTFFARGGMFIQFNVLSPELLRAAQKEPEKYRNVQIRLCGWNVRFIDLSPEVQETFIAEAENRS
jgi:formate C-acetyltransferase